MFDANQEDQVKLTVNKYLAEHGLAYEGKYHTFNSKLDLKAHNKTDTAK